MKFAVPIIVDDKSNVMERQWRKVLLLDLPYVSLEIAWLGS